MGCQASSLPKAVCEHVKKRQRKWAERFKQVMMAGRSLMIDRWVVITVIAPLPNDVPNPPLKLAQTRRRDSMIRNQLRIYCGPEQQVANVATSERKKTVTVPAAEVLATLADAIQQNRAWLNDFDDDEMTISTDLYEVILAYQHYHRPTAG